MTSTDHHDARDPVGSQRLSILLATLGIALVMLALVTLPIGSDPAAAERREAAPSGAGEESSLVASVLPHHLDRVAALGSRFLFLRVVCESDSRPVGRVSVQWVDPRTGTACTSHTDDEGKIDVHLDGLSHEAAAATPVEAHAPGYETWSGSLPFSFETDEDPTEIRLKPRGEIVVRLSEPLDVENVELEATATALGPGPARTVLGSPSGIGSTRIVGLRPGSYFDVNVNARGHSAASIRDVEAGWPEPTVLDVHLSGRQAFEVRLTGNLTPEDCEALSVALVDASGLRGRPARPDWDPIRKLAFATPEAPGSANDRRIEVRGPFGVRLADQAWSSDDGQTPLVTLDLRRCTVALVAPDASPGQPAPWIEWKGVDGRGGLPVQPSALVDLAWTDSTPQKIVDLRWGDLVAPEVSVPRHEPIEFTPRMEGEIRLLGVPAPEADSLTLVRESDSQRSSLGGERDSTDLHASVPAGAYQVLLQSEKIGPPLVVQPGAVTAVSWIALRQTATLIVELPPGDAEQAAAAERVAPDRLIQVLVQKGDTLTPIRSTTVSASRAAAEIHGLPPGCVVVQVKAPGLGLSSSAVTLHPGGETRLVPGSWSAERRVTVRVANANGAPRAGLRVKVWLAPIGTSPVVRTLTDANGEMTIDVCGGGTLVVSTEEGVWNAALGPDQSSVEVRHVDAGEDELKVAFSGWWLDRVRTVGSLTPGAGPLFQLARRGASDNEFFVPRPRAAVALTIVTVEGEMILLQDDFTNGRLLLEEEPASTRLHVESGEGQPAPQFLEARVIEVAGVPVGDCMLTAALGGAVQFGREITFRNAAPLTLVVDGIAAHGGTCWRTDALRLSAGALETTLTLRELP